LGSGHDGQHKCGNCAKWYQSSWRPGPGTRPPVGWQPGDNPPAEVLPCPAMCPTCFSPCIYSRGLKEGGYPHKHNCKSGHAWGGRPFAPDITGESVDVGPGEPQDQTDPPLPCRTVFDSTQPPPTQSDETQSDQGDPPLQVRAPFDSTQSPPAQPDASQAAPDDSGGSTPAPEGQSTDSDQASSSQTPAAADSGSTPPSQQSSDADQGTPPQAAPDDSGGSTPAPQQSNDSDQGGSTQAPADSSGGDTPAPAAQPSDGDQGGS
jgi:hypothetical protein